VRDFVSGAYSIMREIRRRTRVVGAFPDGNSALNLAAARLATSPARAGRPNDI
jgi:transposase-like protein